MLDPWLPILNQLPLSRTEREVVRRYEQDTLGRSFLPVADILRAHRLVDEGLELLTQGVERHPGFTVARVVLARELLQKGLVENAWRVVEDSPVPLRDNLLAQKLRLKMALLLGHEKEARATFRHLSLNQMLDPEGKRLGDLMDVSGFQHARDTLIQEMTARGTTLVLPELKPSTQPTSTPAGEVNLAEAGESEAFRPATWYARTAKPDGFPGLSDEQLGRVEEDASVSGFHVVPLGEIFRPNESTAPVQSSTSGDAIELDSTTLADIYERQGHYGKALAVYRRLLRLTPGSDLFRRKVAELTRLDKEQKDVDLTVDPAVVDKMETVEIIDRQIKFYNDLLSRLS